MLPGIALLPGLVYLALMLWFVATILIDCPPTHPPRFSVISSVLLCLGWCNLPRLLFTHNSMQSVLIKCSMNSFLVPLQSWICSLIGGWIAQSVYRNRRPWEEHLHFDPIRPIVILTFLLCLRISHQVLVLGSLVSLTAETGLSLWFLTGCYCYHRFGFAWGGRACHGPLG